MRTQSRLALFSLMAMITCVDVSVSAQVQQSDKAPSWPPVLSSERPGGIPDSVPWPPPVDKLPPVPDSVLKSVPSDVPVSQEPPIVCPADKHRGPGPGGCVDGAPQMGVTAIQGIPVDEAIGILERHRDELHKIPGVMGSGLGVDGIILDVLPEHGEIPTFLEGLPVQTRPYRETRFLTPAFSGWGVGR